MWWNMGILEGIGSCIWAIINNNQSLIFSIYFCTFWRWEWSLVCWFTSECLEQPRKGQGEFRTQTISRFPVWLGSLGPSTECKMQSAKSWIRSSGTNCPIQEVDIIRNSNSSLTHCTNTTSDNFMKRKKYLYILIHSNSLPFILHADTKESQTRSGRGPSSKARLWHHHCGMDN